MIRTDCEHLTFCRLTKPDWASAIGRDRFGLWCEIGVEPKRGGEPVVQRLRWIPPGRFWMGSPEEEPGRYDDEGPRHLVTLTDGYWLFDTPCTQALWEAVMGKNPSRFQSPTRPVEQVSWSDAQNFLKQINKQNPGLDLSLPSEAQWEYACRAGTEMAIYTGDLDILGENNAPALDLIAWYGGNSERETHRVKLKRTNTWGLYDMLGNVWEWTRDHWHNDYQDAPTDGSAWLSNDADALRVLRGGSWHGYARFVRAAYRRHGVAADRYNDFGFRCIRVQGTKAT
ncbi:MAG: formylglycine-generating enzyme family protein [Phycisphaerales bacterium]|nr:formylglycine-generating enzyme family protein [Phycisphaerales bacterium]